MDKKPSKTSSSTRGCTFLQNKSTSTGVESGDSFYCLNQSVPRPIAPEPRPRTPYPRLTPGPSNSGPSHAGPSNPGPSNDNTGPSHAGPSTSNAGPSNPPPLPARRPSTVWGKTFLAPDDSDTSTDRTSSIRQKTPVRSRHGYLQGFPFPDPPLPEQDIDTPAVSPTLPAPKAAPGPSQLRKEVVLSPPGAAAGGQGSSTGSEISPLSLGPPVFDGGGGERGSGLLSSLQGRVEEPAVEEVRQKTPSPTGGQKTASPGGNPPPVLPFDDVDLTGGEGDEGGGYLTGVKLGCLIVALMASVFLVSLDRTIISTVSLPPSPGNSSN